jgi:hypothetical protein
VVRASVLAGQSEGRLGRRRLGRWGAVVGAVALTALPVAFAGSAGATTIPSTTVYSTDGGSSWSTTLPALTNGETVLVRDYFDNTTLVDEPSISVQATVPAGYTRVGGTTKVCLNPGTTDPTKPTTELVCNTDAGQGGAINEAAVWSGSALTISPSAGIEGQSTSATSGYLLAGRKKYINLEQCSYYNASTNDSMQWDITATKFSAAWSAGTSVTDTAVTAQTCATGPDPAKYGVGYSYQPANSGVQNVSLLGNRYFNLNQCQYQQYEPDSMSTVISTMPWSSMFRAGTTASNNQPTTPVCGPSGDAYNYEAGNSGVQNIDLLGNRYLNLEQCTYTENNEGFDRKTYFISSNSTANGGLSAATTASNTTPTTPTCGPGGYGYASDGFATGVQNFDLLDAARAQGYIQWQMTAPHTYPSPVINPLVGGVGLLGVLSVGGVLFARRRRNAQLGSVA